MKESGLSCPSLLPGLVKEDHIMRMFGKFQLQDDIVLDKQLSVLKLMKIPVSLKEIQSPYGKNSQLWRIACDGNGNIWVSDNTWIINQLDRDGSILKTINLPENVMVLSLNVQQELVFIEGFDDTKICKYKNNSVVTLLKLLNWCPNGFCHTVNDNILVSMRSLDHKRSRVVRYSGTTEVKVIESDNQWKPLFSVGNQCVLLLTENGNGDICVADYAGKSVVVLNLFGTRRFIYKGNIMSKAGTNIFQPLHIVNDEKRHVLISDQSNNIVHIIDSDGNFIRYIEYPCNGGISVDTDHNLVVGELMTGNIRIIKYLE